MTHVVSVLRRATDDSTSQKIVDNRDPNIINRHHLLAENMPSVLKRLRPMDVGSAGIIQYLMTPYIATELPAVASVAEQSNVAPAMKRRVKGVV